MEKKEYQAIYNVEDTHWWYVGLRALVISFVEEFVSRHASPAILDAGCGTGGMLSALKNHNACGIDYAEEALKFCRLRGLTNVQQGSVCDLPYADRLFGIVISLDVLYHLEVADDLLALRELHRVTAPKGMLILNLPAYEFLMSFHDRMNRTRHRYTLREVRDKVEAAGFSVRRISYRNTFLFPPAAAVRLARRFIGDGNKDAESDLRPLPPLLNRMLKNLLLFENGLISRGAHFPFGLSIFCVAERG